MARSPEKPGMSQKVKLPKSPLSRSVLLVKKRELLQLCGESAGSTAALDSRSSHSPEQVDAAFSEETARTAVGVLEAQSNKQQEVQRALRKIQEGTYGLCDECFKPIPIGRLNALPYATRCIKHADVQLRRDERVPKRSQLDEDNAPSLTATEDQVEVRVDNTDWTK